MRSAAEPLVPGKPASGRPRPLATWAVLGLFTLLAVVHTWPLASARTLSRNDNGDYALMSGLWRGRAPDRDARRWHLFDGNIFYPPHTVAYSEHLFARR